ncbi:hypothetical protein NRS6206_03878 [Bacillus subtilis]|nr:hypothetical protein NRS6206_03878 [Bacillus subtilis]
MVFAQRLPVYMLMYHDVQGVPEDVIMASFDISTYL